ncbi:hypothetical protein M405DRAFT_884405 [Rhizopogon salebrosus TDB-379]|nr:hypothetical protein M405DRAFT_884405 [Rhizopogon salebrosus TDB-379]
MGPFSGPLYLCTANKHILASRYGAHRSQSTPKGIASLSHSPQGMAVARLRIVDGHTNVFTTTTFPASPTRNSSGSGKHAGSHVWRIPPADFRAPGYVTDRPHVTSSFPDGIHYQRYAVKSCEIILNGAPAWQFGRLWRRTIFKTMLLGLMDRESKETRYNHIKSLWGL